MSTFASSVIKKSGKKFAPKAPVRRPSATAQPVAQASSSSRVSAERQTSAPTLQQPSIDHAPRSSPQPQTPSSINLPSAPSDESPATEVQRRQPQGATLIPPPSRKRPASPAPRPNLQPANASSVTRTEVISQRTTNKGRDTLPSPSQGAVEPRRSASASVEATEEPARKRRKTGPTASKKSRASTTTQATAEGPSVPEETSSEQATTSRKQTRTKSKKGTNESAEALADAVVADAVGPGKPKRKRRQKRLKTPENAETIEIAPSVVKMADLCKDLHTGRKSQREEELQSMNWTEIARKKKELMAKGESARPDPEPIVEAPRESAEPENEPRNVAAPQMRLVNGEITLDSSSLQVDRHAELTVQTADMEVVEENPLTRKINSATYLKKSPAVSWDEENTALFFRGLRMFGTDFQMISRLFPGRTRRAIKLKFVNEERKDAQRIKDTLLGPKEEVDLASFSLMTNTVYEDPSALDDDVNEDRKAIEAQHAKDKEAHDEMLREAEKIAEEAKGAAAVSSAKENEVEDTLNPDEAIRSKKGRRSGATRKRGQDKTTTSGDVEILGTIELDGDTAVEESTVKKVDRRSAVSPLQETEPQSKTTSSRGKITRKPTTTTKRGTRRKTAAPV